LKAKVEIHNCYQNYAPIVKLTTIAEFC